MRVFTTVFLVASMLFAIVGCAKTGDSASTTSDLEKEMPKPKSNEPSMPSPGADYTPKGGVPDNMVGAPKK